MPVQCKIHADVISADRLLTGGNIPTTGTIHLHHCHCVCVCVHGIKNKVQNVDKCERKQVCDLTSCKNWNKYNTQITHTMLYVSRGNRLWCAVVLFSDYFALISFPFINLPVLSHFIFSSFFFFFFFFYHPIHYLPLPFSSSQPMLYSSRLSSLFSPHILS